MTATCDLRWQLLHNHRKWKLVAVLVLYGTQVGLVTVQFIWPVIDRTVDGNRYVVVHSYPWPWGAIPLFGLTPLIIREPVVLYIIDSATEETRIEGYDL